MAKVMFCTTRLISHPCNNVILGIYHIVDVRKMSNEKRTQIMTKSFLPSWSYVDVVSVRKKWYKMQGVVRFLLHWI